MNPTKHVSSPRGRAEILLIADSQIGRMTFEPGWRWPNDVKPIAGSDSCEAPHFQYHVSGRLAIRMDYGTEMVAELGDITSLPSGHDAWVLGDEPVVVVDWYGASNYAKAQLMTTGPGRATVREGFTIAHREELDRTGNWTLVRRSLDCRSFGVNVVEIPPGESIPEHDETHATKRSCSW